MRDWLRFPRPKIYTPEDARVNKLKKSNVSFNDEEDLAYTEYVIKNTPYQYGSIMSFDAFIRMYRDNKPYLDEVNTKSGILAYQHIKAMSNSYLVDKPLVVPYLDKVIVEGKSAGVSEAGYDIRIKQDVTLYPVTLQNLVINFLLDSKDKWWAKLLIKSYGIGEYRKFYALASTIEFFNIPNDIMVEVADKSSWAREGLALQNTRGEPGWFGNLTLELTNHGTNVIHIKAGMPIAQMVFHKLISPTLRPYKGKYQNQEDRPVESIYEKP